MTAHSKHVLTLLVSTVLVAPLALVLFGFGLFAAFPDLMASSPLWIVLMYAYYVIPGPVGMSVIFVALVSVWIAFVHRTDSIPTLSVLLGYGGVVLCYVGYVAWWHGTSQQFDSL